jgi:transcription termination/antitermination protein NusG
MPEVRSSALAKIMAETVPESLPMEWYALHVRSRHEKIVHAQLEAKKQHVFLPLYSARKKWADRWKVVSLPLFSGYVFCRFDPARRYSVLATTGVIDIVRFGSEPAAIPDSEIEAVQMIVNSSVPAEPHPNLVEGQSVIISDGPLNGLVATLANVRNALRLVVNVQLLGRAVLVEMDRDWIVPHSSANPLHPLSAVQQRRV